MLKLKSILLATDFRPASIEATEVAARLASLFGAGLSLVHVFQHTGATAPGRDEEWEVAEWQIKELADQLADKNVCVEMAKVVEGHPVDQIVGLAQEIGADLVLIGAGSWVRDAPFQAGPIAEAVLQLAGPSVLAVRPGLPLVRFEKILCPVDQSPASELALRTCIDVARISGALVHVVTVVPELTWLAATLKVGPTEQAVAEHKNRWRHDFDQFIASVRADDVPLTCEIRHGIPHEEIAASAAEHDSDVIIMGTTGRTGLARLLMGSVARRVLRSMPCSLWTVKKPELAAEQAFAQDLRHIQLLMAEGRGFLEAGQYQLALFKFRQVCVRNPFHAEALEGQAAAHERLGQHEEARVVRSRAEKLLEPVVEIGA